jgi:hypothetical protein
MSLVDMTSQEAVNLVSFEELLVPRQKELRYILKLILFEYFKNDSPELTND